MEVILFSLAVLLVVAIYLSRRRRRLASAKLNKPKPKFYKDILDGLNDGVRIVENGLVTYVNEHWCAMTGYGHEESLGWGRELAFAPEYRAKLKEQQKLRLQGDSGRYEVQLIRKDGTRMDVVVSARPLWDTAKTKVVGSYAVFTDITPLKQIENELRVREGRFKDFAEAASDLFWEMDKDLRFTYFSNLDNRLRTPVDRKIGNKLFLVANSSIGKTRWELAGYREPHLDERWAEHKNLLLKRLPFRDFCYQVRDTDGKPHHVKVSGKPIYSDDGEFLGYRGCTTEITGQVEALDQAAEAQRRLLDALDSIAEGFVLWDTTERLILCNRRYLEIYPELSDCLYPGAKLVDLLREGLRRGVYELDGSMTEEQFIQKRIEHHRNPTDGAFIQGLSDNRWVQITERKTSDGGVVGVFMDITQLTRREQELVHAQKMEAVGQLTGGVAHDFNNHLAVIIGSLELFLDSFKDKEVDTQLLEYAMDGAKRSSALTQRLLAFSRKQALRPRTVDVAELIDGMSELLSRSLGESVNVHAEFENDLHKLYVDPGQLENAILNLSLNARDAMTDGGTIMITAENCSDSGISELKGEEGVVIKVQDSGVGMSPEVIKRSIEPFFTTKTDSGGSGLGLSSVYGFVKQSNGHLSIGSERGQGSTVRLYFPKAVEGAEVELVPVKAEQPKVVEKTVGETIFIVEDNKMVRELTATMLENMQYKVHTASCGPTALEKLDELGHIDLLLSDVVLAGGINGVELSDRVRAARPDIKVLFMSGYTQLGPNEQRDLADRGLLLKKPFRSTDLAEKVRETLRGGPQKPKLALVS